MPHQKENEKVRDEENYGEDVWPRENGARVLTSLQGRSEATLKRAADAGMIGAEDDAIADADIINLLRIQHERQRKTMFPSLGEYTSLFGLNQARLARTKPDALIMHPGPINRGVEIAAEVADGPYSMILDQVENGLAIRMALLYLLAGGQAASN